MTMTSVGFDGTMDEQDWAKLAAFLGRPPCVENDAAWKVTAVVGPDRTVRIAVGTGYADGVLSTSDATVDVQLAAIASGTRWDAVVARRDWTPTPGGGTTFVAVSGTAAQALPAGLLSNPGVSSDQVLALVQLTAGQSTPTAVLDMRALPTVAAMYPNTLALPPTAPLGAIALVAGRQYEKGAAGWAASFLAAAGSVVSAATSGAAIPSGGTLGVTGGLAVTAATYDRVITLSFAGMCTALTAGKNVEFILRKNGVGVRWAKVNAANITASGTHKEIIPAGVAATYQLVATTSVGGIANVPADVRFVYLTASLSS